MPFNDEIDDGGEGDDDLDMMDDDDDDINAQIDDKLVSPTREVEAREVPLDEDYVEESAPQPIEEKEPIEEVRVDEQPPIEETPVEPIEEKVQSPQERVRQKLEKQVSLLEEKIKSPTDSRSARDVAPAQEAKVSRRNADLNIKGLNLDIDSSPSSTNAYPGRLTTPKAQTTKHAQLLDQRRGSVNQPNKRPPMQPVETPKVSVQQPVSKFGNCRKHKGKPLEVVCMTDKVVICSTCALFDGHQGHQFREVNDLQKEIGDRAEK